MNLLVVTIFVAATSHTTTGVTTTMIRFNTFEPLIPIVAWLVLNTNAGLALATPLRYRLFTLPAILLPAYTSFKTINYLTFPPGVDAVFGFIILIGILHFTSLLYIKGWTVRSEKRKHEESRSTWIGLTSLPWKKIYRITCNPRLINITSHDVDGLSAGQKLGCSSTRRPFSRRIVYRCLIGWLAQLFIMTLLFPGFFMSIRYNDFGPMRQVYFRRLLVPTLYEEVDAVTTRETLMRSVFTIYSFWTTLLVLDTLQVSSALFWISVARVSEPRDWPDVYGSLSEAYTLGRFWSRSVSLVGQQPPS